MWQVLQTTGQAKEGPLLKSKALLGSRGTNGSKGAEKD